MTNDILFSTLENKEFSLVGTDDSKAIMLKVLMYLFKLQTLLLSIIPTFQMRNLLLFS